jgi:hypothetical protein
MNIKKTKQWLTYQVDIHTGDKTGMEVAEGKIFFKTGNKLNGNSFYPSRQKLLSCRTLSENTKV